MKDSKKEIFAKLFSNPLQVLDPNGQIKILDWDQLEETILLNNDGVPIAVIALRNGNGAKIRFDIKPPRLSGFNFKSNRFLIDESDFIDLVGATRANQSLESYLFSEIFKYPFNVAHYETGAETRITVESIFIYKVGSIPIALISRAGGNWAPVRFDTDPLQFWRFDINEREEIDRAEFIELVKRTRMN